jgi:hypothetical protein
LCVTRLSGTCPELGNLASFWHCSVGVPAGDDGKVVTQRSRILTHYLRGWFPCDLVSSLPYEQMLRSNEYGLESVMALLKVRLRL